MGQIIDGKTLSEKIRDGIREEIKKLPLTPGLAVIMIGDNWESKLYIEQKQKACETVGINFSLHQLKDTVGLHDVLELIKKLNEDNLIHGIIVQLPISKELDLIAIQEAIVPWKDVDGFNPINRGLLVSLKDPLEHKEVMIPGTALGCVELLKSIGVRIGGKNIVIVGRSNIVGKPLSILLTSLDATVTLCNSKTKNLCTHTQRAEILVVAVGSPRLIKAEMVQQGAVVLDVGINRVFDKNAAKGYRVVGDVDFDVVKGKASYVSVVPGGVGPMTVAMLLQNVLKASTLR